MKIKYFNQTITYFYCFVFVTMLFGISMGQMGRWDLLEQIAMADRFVDAGVLYPELGGTIYAGVSVYFPGLALLAISLLEIFPNLFIVEVMHIISVIVVLLFILVQKNIIIEIYGDKRIDKFYPIIISYTLLFCKDWLLYAVEFKPDTIALLLGYTGLLLSRSIIMNRVKVLGYFLSSLLIGVAIIFKQQYIAFLVALIIYSIIVDNLKHRILTILAVLFSILTLVSLSLCFDSIWFWTITVLVDDGFRSFISYLGSHWNMSIRIFWGILFIYGINYYHKENIGRVSLTNREHYIKYFTSSPWPLIILMNAIAAFLSAFKVGGNAGNTALGFMLVFPVVYPLISGLEKKLILLITSMAILVQAPSVAKGVMNYRRLQEYTNYCTGVNLTEDMKILTGSNVYYSTRKLRNFTTNITTNYWNPSASVGVQDSTYLFSIISGGDFDYLFVENWPTNKSGVLKAEQYDVIYENRFGLVAKNKATLCEQ